MKCPKCGYLGFEEVDRCRNCGYEFSLAQRVPLSELSLNDRRTTDANPLEDLSFLKERGTDAEKVSVASSPPEDLPLFSPPIPDDEPLIAKPPPPRQPLAVRRATPEVRRLRAEARSSTFDLAFDSEPVPQVRPAAEAPTPWASSAERAPRGAGAVSAISDDQDAGLGARFFAVIIDVLILAIVDALVVYFTMQICGITFFDLGVLPKGPLLAFLFVQNGGYLVAFTAGGQTLGKMAMGIRVVTAEDSEPLDLGRALVRTMFWFVLAIPGGLGFLTALLSRDHRGLHDRFAGTRVIRASA